MLVQIFCPLEVKGFYIFQYYCAKVKMAISVNIRLKQPLINQRMTDQHAQFRCVSLLRILRTLNSQKLKKNCISCNIILVEALMFIQ